MRRIETATLILRFAISPSSLKVILFIHPTLPCCFFFLFICILLFDNLIVAHPLPLPQLNQIQHLELDAPGDCLVAVDRLHFAHHFVHKQLVLGSFVQLLAHFRHEQAERLDVLFDRVCPVELEHFHTAASHNTRVEEACHIQLAHKLHHTSEAKTKESCVFTVGERVGGVGGG